MQDMFYLVWPLVSRPNRRRPALKSVAEVLSENNRGVAENNYRDESELLTAFADASVASVATLRSQCVIHQ